MEEHIRTNILNKKICENLLEAYRISILSLKLHKTELVTLKLSLQTSESQSQQHTKGNKKNLKS